MPDLRTESPVIAILCADIHLSAKPPLARSDEPDWYAAMARPLNEMSDLSEIHSCPVLCAGDVFDRWSVPPELLSFAFDHLPSNFYVIPGQHDLPYHGYDEMWRSGLGVLLKADRVSLLSEKPVEFNSGLGVSGFAWGRPITKLDERSKTGLLNIALVHAYCWHRQSYEGADKNAAASIFDKSLETNGFDLGVFGDNHIPFEVGRVYNCGGFMRRKSDDSFRPSCGLLFASGRVARHYFSTAHDSFKTTSAKIEIDPAIDEGIKSFVGDLMELECDPLDFEAKLRYMADVEENPAVKSVLRRLIDANYR